MPNAVNYNLDDHCLQITPNEMEAAKNALMDVFLKRGMKLPAVGGEVTTAERAQFLLNELLEHDVEVSEMGEVIIINSPGSRLEGQHEDEQEVWFALAPFMESESYVEATDDDGTYRFIFKDEVLYCQTVSEWPEPKAPNERIFRPRGAPGEGAPTRNKPRNHHRLIPLEEVVGKTIESIEHTTVPSPEGPEPCIRLQFTDGTQHGFVIHRDED